MTVYKTYEEAHKKLRIPGSYQRGTIGSIEAGVQSLKITRHPDSYDRILNDGKYILYVGRGNKVTPAHPVRDQKSEEQELFRTSIRTKTPFPVLYKSAPNHVELLGYYTVQSVRRVEKDKNHFYYAKLKKYN